MDENINKIAFFIKKKTHLKDHLQNNTNISNTNSVSEITQNQDNLTFNKGCQDIMSKMSDF